MRSVRAEARRTVAPDSVLLTGTTTAWRDSKSDAVTAAATALESLTRELSELGGVPLTVEAQRSVLTWSAFSATTYAEREHDPIRAALRKGRDYAAALGVSLSRVQHVADTGLLGESGDSPEVRRVSRAAFASAGQDTDTPSLDPVPRELAAVIEARFQATTAALPAS